MVKWCLKRDVLRLPADLRARAPLLARMWDGTSLTIRAEYHTRTGWARADNSFRRIMAHMTTVVAVWAKCLKAAVSLIGTVRTICHIITQLRNIEAACLIIAQSRRMRAWRRLENEWIASAKWLKEWQNKGEIILIKTFVKPYSAGCTVFFIASVDTILGAIALPQSTKAAWVVSTSKLIRPTGDINASYFVGSINAIVLQVANEKSWDARS